MKKKLITALLLTFMGLQVFSQKIAYGPKAGLNLSKLSFSSDDFKTSLRPGFYLGGFLNYSLAEKMSLQGELLLSMEGTNEKRISSGSKGHINKMYLHLPVLFQYDLTQQVYAEAGPQIGLLLSSKEKYGSGGTSDIKEYYNSTDIRVPVGIGYKFSDKLQGLKANIRFSFSLSPVNNTPVGGGDLKNQVLSVGVQYALPGKK